MGHQALRTGSTLTAPRLSLPWSDKIEAMAQIERRRVENVSGNFYVDETCIDCDACRWLAPEVFREAGDKSAVYHQPQTDQETLKALQALVACPTASIGAVEKSNQLAEVSRFFPLPIEENVFYCGYHSEGSFGAASYFIERKEGNVLIDSPRFAGPLVENLEKRGGLRYLFLTHLDDVADHARFQNHFHCERILHADDVTADTDSVEIKISDKDPFTLAEDLMILPVPGHTKGHSVLIYKNKFLFTGDHLAYSPGRKHLIAFRDACWYSWPELIKSMERLSQYDFEWVLPGHGRRFHATRDQMKKEMQKCLAWMREEIK